jgi:hypothetical protein
MHSQLLTQKAIFLPFLQVNHEHFWKEHSADHHTKIDVFLCKTQVCMRLMPKYITDKGLNASYFFLDNLSSDPTVPPSSSQSGNPPHTMHPGPSFLALNTEEIDYNKFIHVRGKSGRMLQ